MGYGLQVENNNNEFIIDSDEPYSSFGILSQGSASLSTSNSIITFSNTSAAPLNGTLYRQSFPSGVSGNDLFFVNIPNNGFVAEEGGVGQLLNGTHTWVHQFVSGGSTTYKYKEMNVMSHANMTIQDWDSGYGLTVFKEYTGTPQQTDLIFSSVLDQGVNIVACGTFRDIANANQTFTTVTVNSSDPHYVLINGSEHTLGIWQYSLARGYYFTYSSSSVLASIKVYAAQISSWGLLTVPSTFDALDQSWMIIKVKGDT